MWLVTSCSTTGNVLWNAVWHSVVVELAYPQTAIDTALLYMRRLYKLYVMVCHALPHEHHVVLGCLLASLEVTCPYGPNTEHGIAIIHSKSTMLAFPIDSAYSKFM